LAPRKEEVMTQTMFAIAGLGPTETVLIVLVIFLLFGATRLPQLAKALGQSKKAFREGIEEGERVEHKEIKEAKE
jgi:TatA/E family protein of Tat protein translocase